MSDRRRLHQVWPSTLFALALAASYTQAATSNDRDDVYDMSLQDLMKMEVTSASKKEQTLAQVPAAVYVIDQDDIRRSGALNIPDLLRMVPGLDVTQINANTWAISARGFNTQFANKLLVLIDGRSVYTPTQDGVNWDTQDVPMEDIERIEVIRGPGATVWGANAVNGVINVITKRADATPGTLVTGGGGTTANKEFGTVQYGGVLPGDAAFRVFAKYLNVGDLPDITALFAADAWHLLHGGFRLDKAFSETDSITAEGDIYKGREGSVIAHIASISESINDFEARPADLSGSSVLWRWNHTSAPGSETTLQIYLDRYFRSGPESNETRSTVDVDFHNQLQLSARQDVVWGAAYRYTYDQIFGTIDQGYLTPHLGLQFDSVFIQDEIRFDRVAVYVGTKLEHTDLAPFEVEPSIRMTFTPTPRDTWWAAVSQAARTPARRDVDADINLGAFVLPNGMPALSTLFGNPREESEKLLSFELGYRTQFTDHLSLDVSTYLNKYRDLRSVEPGAPVDHYTPVSYVDLPREYGNLVYGETEGFEISAKIQVMDRWTLSPGYTYLHMDMRKQPYSLDTTTIFDTEGSSPQHQAQLRSAVNISENFSVNTSVAFVDRLPAQQIASYTRVDSNLIWRPKTGVEMSLVGQNLLHERHLESNDIFTSVNSSQMVRSVYAKITLRF